MAFDIEFVIIVMELMFDAIPTLHAVSIGDAITWGIEVGIIDPAIDPIHYSHSELFGDC